MLRYVIQQCGRAGLCVAICTTLSAFAAEPTNGQASAGDEARVEQPSTPKKDRLVCRRSADTGSHIGKRSCRRQSEIDAEAREHQEAFGRALDSAAVQPGGGPG